MVNILLEGFKISDPWIYDELKNYIKPSHKVVVIAFSFRDNLIKNIDDWNTLYSKENGQHYKGIIDSLADYGVSEDNITFINYFADTKETAGQKVIDSDIIYFPGGLPDRMMERIKEFELYDVLARYDGIVMGNSAGALIQLSEYHLSPDRDYPKFKYYEGLPYLDSLYLEVHYMNTDIQNESINRVLSERGKTVYATEFMTGAIIVDNGNIKLLGNVKTFIK